MPALRGWRRRGLQPPRAHAQGGGQAPDARQTNLFTLFASNHRHSADTCTLGEVVLGERATQAYRTQAWDQHCTQDAARRVY